MVAHVNDTYTIYIHLPYNVVCTVQSWAFGKPQSQFKSRHVVVLVPICSTLRYLLLRVHNKLSSTKTKCCEHIHFYLNMKSRKGAVTDDSFN